MQNRLLQKRIRKIISLDVEPVYQFRQATASLTNEIHLILLNGLPFAECIERLINIFLHYENPEKYYQTKIRTQMPHEAKKSEHLNNCENQRFTSKQGRELT